LCTSQQGPHADVDNPQAAGYPEDEAATREKLQFRIEQAPNAFLLATTSGGGGADEIVG
jgi:hypothetical protein